MDENSRAHAVVFGGSMAGLLAARVLAETYAQVTVVDRDTLPDRSTLRRGIPQGRHAHALLARGQQVLEELFPGLTAELVAKGVPAGDVLRDARMYLNGHRLCSTDTGLVFLCASRAFLEHHVRARVRALRNVTVVDRCEIVGLATTPDRCRVTGARALHRVDGGAEQVLGADLVVDTTGRGSRAPVWLQTLGYERPEEERVAIGLGYATRMYRLRPGMLGGQLASVHAPTPAHPRGGVLSILEGDNCMVTLAGILGDHPPTDPDGFVDFARSLQFPDIYEAIHDAKPLDDPVAFRFPASVRRRYERLSRFPDAFLVMGDGVCSFNPVYGQGMSVAALEALTLRRHLRSSSQPQPRRFLRDVARVVDGAWDVAVGGDLAFPAVAGRRTRRIRLANAYIARLHAAAAHDARLAAAFVRVSGLVDGPEALLHPRIASRVLWRTLHGPPRRPFRLDSPPPLRDRTASLPQAAIRTRDRLGAGNET